MKRVDSRISLEITDVDAMRVQDIDRKQARMEGMAVEDVMWKNQLIHPKKCPEENYRTVWDSINEDRGLGWDVNPWCWRIRYKLAKPAKHWRV